MLNNRVKPFTGEPDWPSSWTQGKNRLILGLGLVMAAVALLALTVSSFARPTPPTTSTHQVGSSPARSDQGRDTLAATIIQAQERLHLDPSDRDTWARLGSAYLQQAQLTADPAYYPRAQGALQRSLALEPATNWQAMTGLGALANARNDFAQGLDWAHRAVAVNADDASAYAVLDAALTQLGDYPGATSAARRMLELQPDTAALTSAADHFQARGDRASARRILRRALAEATEQPHVADCNRRLGELAFDTGNPKAALQYFRLGLVADPDSAPLLAGRAKTEAALGRVGAALHDYANLIARVPQPQYLLENAELLQSLGRDDQAEQQLAQLTSQLRQLAENGVINDLMIAVVEADHGSATAAVRHAQAEWRRRKGALVADALGWALHRAGRDHEAQLYAGRANRLGGPNATYRYHLGLIEFALGDRAAAHRNLALAMKLNPYFSTLQAPVARRAMLASKIGGVSRRSFGAQ
jgi:tetratricopeptide (TPR) repeat protein